MQNLIKFHQFVQLSVNKILTITKGHNSVVNLRKWMRNKPNLDVVKVNVYAKSDEIPLICSQARGNKILTITKGHNCVVNLRKMGP